MGYKVDNAIIMAAGTASRFAPISYERPKALIEVRGEILIERQIKQILAAGIENIILVVGYMKEQFYYLEEKYGVKIVENKEYLVRNNNSSIYAVKDYLKNSYICSSDNYFYDNPFEKEVDESYYAAVFSQGETPEWCMQEDSEGYVCRVDIGGRNSWYMLGHVFWDEKFSRRFVDILCDIYDDPETTDLLWEGIYMKNLDTLKMKIRKYPEDFIFEFDTLDELRQFDISYIEDTRSLILKEIAEKVGCHESDIINVASYKEKNVAIGFTCDIRNEKYEYRYEGKQLYLRHSC